MPRTKRRGRRRPLRPTREFPPIVSKQHDDTWFFNVSYEDARRRFPDPTEYLLDRFPGILEAIAEHYLPTSVTGDFKVIDGPTGRVRHGHDLSIADDAGLRIPRLVEVVRSEMRAVPLSPGEWAAIDVDIRGRTKVSYPTDAEVRDEFIGVSHYGPWARGAGGRETVGAAWFDDILTFAVADPFPGETHCSVFVSTHSWVWDLTWEDFPRALAEEATRRNRARLVAVLTAVREALPEAITEVSNPGRDPPMNERGYAWDEGNRDHGG